MKTLNDKITLNLDGNTEVNVKGFIAPIEYTQYNFHIKWEALANLRVAEPEKQHPVSIFQAFLPSESISVGDCWQIEAGVLELLRQLHPNPRLDLWTSITGIRMACGHVCALTMIKLQTSYFGFMRNLS